MNILLVLLKFDSISISSRFKHFTKSKSDLLTACSVSANKISSRKKCSIFDYEFRYLSIKVKQTSGFANSSKRNRISLLYENAYKFMLFAFCISIKTFELMRFFSKKLSIRIVALLIDIRLASSVAFSRNSLRL